MPVWLSAALWGWFAGSSLLIGAALGFFLDLPARFISSVMAFGSGVLISALCFELMDKASKAGGLMATAAGCLTGAMIYSYAAKSLNKHGAKYRKRSGEYQVSEKDVGGSGKAIALGALLDGIPESIVIGISLISNKEIGLVTIFAIFISNIPEGLSSSNGMKNAGRSKGYIFKLWFGIAFVSGIFSFLGNTIFAKFPIEIISSIIGVAAGAILAMVVNTMIPEAYEEEHEWAGIITVVGFLISFITSKF